jgi:hypothetical protein
MVETFPIVPASAKSLWFLGGISCLLVLVLAALLYTAYASQHARVEVSAAGLRIAGDFWGRTIPIQSIELPGARALDLAGSPEHSPKRRTFGTGLPGYASGWFRLRNGEKALVYLTDRRRVAYLPTSLGYSIVLSVAEPERLLEALSRRAH